MVVTVQKRWKCWYASNTGGYIPHTYGLDTADLLSVSIKKTECRVFDGATASLEMLIDAGPKVNGCKGPEPHQRSSLLNCVHA